MVKTLRPGEPNKRGNIITARIVPVFLLGIVGYSTWVVTDLVCVRYLLDPPSSLSIPSRTGAAIGILVTVYISLVMMLVCFGRLMTTVMTNPGLVPRGPQYWLEKTRRKQREESPLDGTGSKEAGLEYGSTEGFTPPALRSKHHLEESQSPFRPQDFWKKDVFTCLYDGRPPFCSHCYNYKPDRAHHCRELGRCVLKMDHFCPWVGGIVSETGFKYFIQFTGWAALFCLEVVVVMGVMLARRRSEDSGFLNVHWILVLVLSGLFFIFSAGMCGSSLQFAVLNSTTIENFTRKTKVWYVAVYLEPRVLAQYQKDGRSDLRLISYPRPETERVEVLRQAGANVDEAEQDFARQGFQPGPAGNEQKPATEGYAPQSSSPTATDHQGNAVPTQMPSLGPQPPSPSPPSQSSTIRPHPQETRTFAILETPPGANPFDVGTLNNFREVMGYTPLEWLLPIRPSPLVKHDDRKSLYKIGDVVGRMRRDASIEEREGVLDEKEKREKPKNEKRKRRRRKEGDVEAAS